jgi:glucokinase
MRESRGAFLAGDIGGTNARFLLAASTPPESSPPVERDLPVRDFPTFVDALRAFLAAVPSGTRDAIDAACLAVAGPIEGNRVKLTNAPWSIDGREIAAAFRIREVRLVNDFHAVAEGIASVAPGDLLTLQAGLPRAGAASLVIGAGTGLGVAWLIPCGARAHVVTGEGGHVGFAPADDEQLALWRFLAPSLGRVTAEHLLSGPGIVRLYMFAASQLRGDAAATLPPDVLREGAAAVARRAHDASDATARHAIALFGALLGAVAGDHALSAMALGGVYLAGGIAPKLARDLAAGPFVHAFRAKGVHAELMERVPVAIVLDERVGLRGAAGLARASALARDE